MVMSKHARKRIEGFINLSWGKNHEKHYDVGMLENVYSELLNEKNPIDLLKVLDDSSFFENFLWPAVTDHMPLVQVQLLCLMITHKASSNPSILKDLDSSKFNALFDHVIRISYNENLHNSFCLVRFITLCVESLHVSHVKKLIYPLTNISILDFLESHEKVDRIFSTVKAYRKAYLSYKQKLPEILQQNPNHTIYSGWLHQILMKSNLLLQENTEQANLKPLLTVLGLCLTFLSAFPTRRFSHLVITDSCFDVFSHTSLFYHTSTLFQSLTDSLRSSLRYPYDNAKGIDLSEKQIMQRDEQLYHSLQTTLFTFYQDRLQNLLYFPHSWFQKRENLEKITNSLTYDDLKSLCQKCYLRTSFPQKYPIKLSSSFLKELFVSTFEKHEQNLFLNSTDDIIHISLDDLFFQERILTESQELSVPFRRFQGYQNQNLSISTFFQRNMRTLYDDLCKKVASEISFMCNHSPLKGSATHQSHNTIVSIKRCRVQKVAPPLVGEIYPQYIHCKVDLDTERKKDIFTLIQENSFVCLLSIADFKQQKRSSQGLETCTKIAFGRPFKEHDDSEVKEGKDINFKNVNIYLDPLFYSNKVEKEGFIPETMDFNYMITISSSVKDTWNEILANRLLLKKTGNFPRWLVDCFLGFGAPNLVTFPNVGSNDITFKDIVSSRMQLEKLFTDAIINLNNLADPISIRYQQGKTLIETKVDEYPNTSIPKKASFNDEQCFAILNSLQPGLTLVNGPSQTGKHTLVCKILETLTKNFQDKRSLVICKSRDSLNKLFHIMEQANCFDEGRILCLNGQSNGNEYNLYGTIKYLISKLPYLLTEVDRLASSMNAVGAYGSNPETALYFYDAFVRPAWNNFYKLASASDDQTLWGIFPFKAFFGERLNEAPDNTSRVIDKAMLFYSEITHLFMTIRDVQPYTFFKRPVDCEVYALCQQANIIGSTWKEILKHLPVLSEKGFSFSNLIVLDSESISEYTIVKLLTCNESKSGLQRLVCIGDDKTSSYSNSKLWDTQNSSFSEKLRQFGVFCYQLKTKYNIRKPIGELIDWQYNTQFQYVDTTDTNVCLYGNSGFVNEYQFIDVGPFKGAKENEVKKGNKQNLGEAEYAVAIYQYMRMLGYPADEIGICTLHESQVPLLREILNVRCSNNSLFGLPLFVKSVKNLKEHVKYMIFTTVSSETIPKEWSLGAFTKAISCSRYGLYVLCCRELLEKAVHLGPLRDKALATPEKLLLTTGELYPKSHKIEDDVEKFEIEDLMHLSSYVVEMTKKKLQIMNS
ncbi:complexed with Cdc5 protein Cwf11 [Schizosaccharomyces cryophilus OY26]|uniref:Complexed with Cdc5 protein Cwf11 n=1 Tax=Schizosaccharomyces cryophilus (strain OY26 / ATCC MYA-4695 / CBS 11777 / NBRC 106824 / NRRL Y48691) TaxID=653667 RepID=S9W8S1_SCHCR|nr:complexed with Cdc5 protein Cwf11 [Schizosaccharomyces cryophilus OY26]EPY54290.1 complexed with Cdc5 protein Cwf11 [Schizosaccharomyces cryophilus OY26]